MLDRLQSAVSAGSASTDDSAVSLINIRKVFDSSVPAVDGVSLSFRKGEFFSLLGPSGCGKTTILRMIAGFERPTSGQVLVASRDVTNVPPHKREMSMVFQNYALFPHRTVFQNVAFGLRMRSVNRKSIETRVSKALKMVALEGLEHRKPSQLSGGQQQRVALARAIVVDPQVLLCDEPLAALDKKLRQTMQIELKQLQRILGVTLIFVTHDQEEALAMSDRIAVMNAGRIEQVASPSEIYNRPQSRFVADFIGDINLFKGRIISSGAKRLMEIDEAHKLELPNSEVAHPVAAALRPEKIRLLPEGGPGTTKMSGVIENVIFQGNGVLYRVRVGEDRRLLAREPNEGRAGRFQIGGDVHLDWAVSDVTLLPR
jgi:putative spermidine/putrescine transport system ATP-binding protein